jgi:uncharacterized protein with HEPN domain
MSSERDSIYLSHILECIERIQNYTGNNKELLPVDHDICQENE